MGVGFGERRVFGMCRAGHDELCRCPLSGMTFMGLGSMMVAKMAEHTQC